MKKFVFFVILWLVAIIFQAFFDSYFSTLKFSFFFALAYCLAVFFRGFYDSLFLAFLGLTYDYLSFSLLGSYAVVFFFSYYVPYFFILEKENFWQHILAGFIVFCGMHFLWIFINYLFIAENHLFTFFTSSLWVEVVPTTALLLLVFLIIRKLERKFFYLD